MMICDNAVRPINIINGVAQQAELDVMVEAVGEVSDGELAVFAVAEEADASMTRCC